MFSYPKKHRSSKTGNYSAFSFWTLNEICILTLSFPGLGFSALKTRAVDMAPMVSQNIAWQYFWWSAMDVDLFISTGQCHSRSPITMVLCYGFSVPDSLNRVPWPAAICLQLARARERGQRESKAWLFLSVNSRVSPQMACGCWQAGLSEVVDGTSGCWVTPSRHRAGQALRGSKQAGITLGWLCSTVPLFLTLL